jgi:hypothetical protein
VYCIAQLGLEHHQPCWQGHVILPLSYTDAQGCGPNPIENIGQAFFRGMIQGFKVGSLLDGQDGGVGPSPGELPGDDEEDPPPEELPGGDVEDYDTNEENAEDLEDSEDSDDDESDEFWCD